MEYIDFLSAKELSEAIKEVKAIKPFVKTNVFNKIYRYGTNRIEVEIYKSNDKIAKYTSANSDALDVEKNDRILQTFTLPRIYEKKIFSVNELRQMAVAGGYLQGVNQALQISNELIVRELEDLKNRIERRIELACCEIISTGKLIIDDEYFKASYDFGFVNGRNLITLPSDSKWNKETATPLTDIAKWKLDIAKRTGLTADTLILGQSAFEALLNHEKVIQALQAPYLQVNGFDLRANPDWFGMQIGNLLGLKLYVYNQVYTGNDNSEEYYIAPDRAVLVASASDGFRLHFGAVYRFNDRLTLNAVANEIYVEPVMNTNGTIVEWRTEVYNLPAVHEPDAVISAKVV